MKLLRFLDKCKNYLIFIDMQTPQNKSSGETSVRVEKLFFKTMVAIRTQAQRQGQEQIRLSHEIQAT